MVGELITLPLRLGLRAARVAARPGIEVAGRAVSLAGFALRTVTGSESGGQQAPAAPRREEQRSQPVDVPRDPRIPAEGSSRARVNGSVSDAGQTTTDEAPAEAEEVSADNEESPGGSVEMLEPLHPEGEGIDYDSEPLTPLVGDQDHVSEEPVLVEEAAEPGAEDGAGAQLHVAEPWEGFSKLGARDVISRIADASPEELAAVQLYEALHRKRETVLTAVERTLRAKTGRGAAATEKTTKEQQDGG